ncbi:MAG: LysR family transcriptional regulator [Terrimicrobiaceae bacterium]
MNLQLNYHHLRYFLAVAAQGGIQAAAKVVHVSPPTLSAQVRELEDFLGTALFRREGRGMQLTPAGRVVRRYAERIMDFGDEMVEVVHRGGVGGVETVLLGIADSVPKLLASRLLSRAWAEMPDLRVVVREGLPSELFPALASHQVDLVLANEPPPAAFRTVLFSARAGRFGVRLAAAPELRRRFRQASGLADFPVLVPARGSALRRDLDLWWSEAGWVPDIRAEFDDAAAMYELAAAGIGAAPVVDAVAQDVTKRYGLVELPCRTGIHEDLYVVTAEREFSHEGPKLIARLARGMSKRGKE